MRVFGKVLLVAVVVSLGVTVHAAKAPAGFGDLAWGATTAGVQAAFPEAKCKSFRAEKGHTAERCELKNFKIAGALDHRHVLHP